MPFLVLVSNSTKIRWQQYDNYSAKTDGIAIDNVLIKDGSSDLSDEDIAAAFGKPAQDVITGPDLIEGLEFYPNPFQNHVQLHVPDDFGPVSNLAVYDLTGKQIFSASNLAQGQAFEFGHDLAPGVYMVRVQAQDAIQVIKAVKTERTMYCILILFNT